MIHAQQAWSDIGKPGTGASGAIPVVDRFDPLVLLLVGVLLFYVFLLVFLLRFRWYSQDQCLRRKWRTGARCCWLLRLRGRRRRWW